jgi:uncharacterized damage-inducible protein DinB
LYRYNDWAHRQVWPGVEALAEEDFKRDLNYSVGSIYMQRVHVMAYLETLTPDELEREVRPSVWEDGRPPIKVWEVRTQVANHSTDHRAQTLAGLHRLGAPTVMQDFRFYAWSLRG